MCVFAITETVINPTPGNVVKKQIIMFMSGNINKTISGHEPMTIGNTQSYLEKIRHEPIFDYRELGNDLRIFLCLVHYPNVWIPTLSALM